MFLIQYERSLVQSPLLSQLGLATYILAAGGAENSFHDAGGQNCLNLLADVSPISLQAHGESLLLLLGPLDCEGHLPAHMQWQTLADQREQPEGL